MVKRLGAAALAIFLALAFTQNTLSASDGADASRLAAVTEIDAVEAARRLNALGLFRGVGENGDGTPDFALGRVATRVEAVCMSVKLMGKEAEALNGVWTTPFIDVPEWAGPYIGYANANRLLDEPAGVHFDRTGRLVYTEFLSLILGALGYFKGTDFSEDTVWALSESLDITLSDPGAAAVFTRGDIALISFHALGAKYGNSDRTLCDMLIEAGVLADSASGHLQHDAIMLTETNMPLAGAPEPAPEPAPEIAVFRLINKEREKHGLEALDWDTGLAAVALAHSTDMSDRGFFNHYNPDGKSPTDRIRAGGLVFKYVGENIARGYGTAESVVAAWMDSATHRSAILSEKATHMGVGVYNRYWTVNFMG